MISAKVIADSKNKFENRITTMVVTFPRIILAEFNTHRMFSRNSASSRAIPFEKMVKSVEENPFIPIAWQKDHKGMQGVEYLDKQYSFECTQRWLIARDNAIKETNYLSGYKATKQLCNRLLEPFMWHTVIVTATEWENFFALRCPRYSIQKDRYFRSQKDLRNWYKGIVLLNGEQLPITDLEWLQINKDQAEIHMMALAEAMWDAYNESTPKELKAGEWHIPFGDNMDHGQLAFAHTNGNIQEVAIKVATARCARVSYTVVGEEGKPDNYENDIKLHDRLAASGHWSPFEHCAQAMNKDLFNSRLSISNNGQHGWSGNFRGFIQYRKTFKNENIIV